jgi:APA family basic amino acid/polyamine antiporter
MVGAGVFMMPALLGAYGGISLIGWLLSTIGAIIIAVLFSRFSKLLPGLQGGPYAYTRKGMGEFPAFLVAWGYWISVWTTNAALAVAFASYLSVLIPVLNDRLIYSVIAALVVIWGLTWFNTLGISKVGKMSMVTTVLKLSPIVLIGFGGIFLIDFSHFTPFNLSEDSSLSAITATTALTFFSFLGIESATIPAENIKNPQKSVPFATKWGTILAASVYIISSISVMGLIAPDTLSQSAAPFADMPEAIARDKLFPSIFARENKNKMPAAGIIISSGLASLLILMSYSGGLLEVFEFMILVSTVSVLIPYIFCAVSYVIILRAGKIYSNKKRDISFIALLTVVFSLYALVGTGYDSIFWGLLFLLIGVPVYLFLKRRNSL